VCTLGLGGNSHVKETLPAATDDSLDGITESGSWKEFLLIV
jgi:hypothetical protein